MTNFEKVGLFMRTFGQEVKKKSSLSSNRINDLRINLIEEELNEFKYAMSKKDLKEVADALTDILYVTYGAGHAFGINLDDCFEEVQKSNMSKLGNDGKPIYNENGKVMKGPNYFKPNLNKFLT
jgi:predicted HAD superfamily Cof-like phosphohydrolase